MVTAVVWEFLIDVLSVTLIWLFTGQYSPHSAHRDAQKNSLSPVLPHWLFCLVLAMAHEYHNVFTTKVYMWQIPKTLLLFFWYLKINTPLLTEFDERPPQELKFTLAAKYITTFFSVYNTFKQKNSRDLSFPTIHLST